MVHGQAQDLSPIPDSGLKIKAGRPMVHQSVSTVAARVGKEPNKGAIVRLKTISVLIFAVQIASGADVMAQPNSAPEPAQPESEPASATAVEVTPAATSSGPAAPSQAAAPAPLPVTRATPSVDPSHHVHDGFFLRFLIGPAGFATGAEIQGDTMDISGGGAAFSVAIGGTLPTGVVLFGELFDYVAVGPSIEINGQSTDTTDDVSAGVSGIGAGIAYYFPSNFYLSATLALAQLSLEVEGDEVNSDVGFGLNGVVGKEWWVSSQWGVGLAGQLFLGSIPDGDASWATAGVMVAFSATCN